MPDGQRITINPFAFTWTAPSDAIRSNNQTLGLNDILYGVTVSSDTSNSGPCEVEIYLINTGSGLLSLSLELGVIWNGDVDGQVSWKDTNGLGPFMVPHSVRVVVQNFTGDTITIAESILRGTVK